MNSILVAGACAAIVTSTELAFRNQRHPFGDLRQKACAWWAAIVLIDGVIAVLLLLGFVSIDPNLSNGPPTKHEPIAAALVGILGPLSLRSPIRRKEVDGKEAGLGITYVYDIVRIGGLRALDERMVRLRRIDVEKTRILWISHGLTPGEVSKGIETHIEAHERMDLETKQSIRDGLVVCRTFPLDEARMEGLIKLMRANRLRSLIDEYSAAAKGR